MKVLRSSGTPEYFTYRDKVSNVVVTSAAAAAAVILILRVTKAVVPSDSCRYLHSHHERDEYRRRRWLCST